MAGEQGHVDMVLGNKKGLIWKDPGCQSWGNVMTDFMFQLDWVKGCPNSW